jgi:hypothetical protein
LRREHREKLYARVAYSTAAPGRSASPLEPMKVALAVLSFLWSAVCSAQDLVVVAKIDELPTGQYQMLKEPGCDKPTASGELVICTGGWHRYHLTNVMTLEGQHLADTIALIYADLHLGGAKLLTLEALSHRDSTALGASYKVKTIGRAFSVVCSDSQLSGTSRELGPFSVKELGDYCYALPLPWAG